MSLKHLVTAASIALLSVATVSAYAQQAPPAPPAKPAAPAAPAAGSIAGNWKFALQGPQGEVSLAIVLKLDGKKLTGSLTGPTGEASPIEGEFADGKLTFAVTVEGGVVLNFNGTTKDADHLDGAFTTPMGELPITGTRVK